MGGFIPAPLIPANGPRTSPPSRTATHGAEYPWLVRDPANTGAKIGRAHV